MSKTNTVTKTPAKTTPATEPKENTSSKVTKQTVKAPTGGQNEMVECDKFDITKFSFTEVDMGDKPKGPNKAVNKSQYTAYPRYNYGTKAAPNEQQFYFKTKPIKFVQGGIPKAPTEFIKTDKQRDFFRVPEDKSQPGCVELFKMFEAIDAFFMNPKNKAKLFTNDKLKKFEKLYEYMPIVRTPQPNENDEEGKERLRYAKIKLATDYESGDLTTFVFSRTNGIPEMVKGLKTITDLTNHFAWNCTGQFIINANKIWLNKSGDAKGKRNFGVAFKCPQLEILEKPAGGQKANFQKYAFGDNLTSTDGGAKPEEQAAEAETGGENDGGDQQEENGAGQEEAAAEQEVEQEAEAEPEAEAEAEAEPEAEPEPEPEPEPVKAPAKKATAGAQKKPSPGAAKKK
jgi:hypothetical protein